MIIARLKTLCAAATTGGARSLEKTGKRPDWRRTCELLMMLAGVAVMSGCISVSAPEKPIVIELNINIKQEVIYRLAADAANTIDENPDIF